MSILGGIKVYPLKLKPAQKIIFDKYELEGEAVILFTTV